DLRFHQVVDTYVLPADYEAYKLGASSMQFLDRFQLPSKMLLRSKLANGRSRVKMRKEKIRQS
ncbi:MAG: hypothetical protein L6R41_007153, partial [Letrouitia leprolyta]